MARKRLTAIEVQTIKRPGFHRDPMTVGLYLKVTPSKSGVARSWCYRYNSPTTGALRWLGLGSIELLSLADARKLAQDYRRVVRRPDRGRASLARRCPSSSTTRLSPSFRPSTEPLALSLGSIHP